MPLYEYECTQCHRRLEKIQKFSDPELTVCPYCAGALERTVTAPAIQFKGSGWYKDLYSSAKPPAAVGSETTGSGSGDTGAETGAATAKTEAKPSTPAAAAPAASSASPGTPISSTGG